jgi:hypothetical protein
MNQCVLFFDIDGCLNDHTHDSISDSGTIDPGAVKAFNRIIATCYPTLILASAWRYRILDHCYSLPGFALMLRTHGIHAAVTLLLQGHLRADTMVTSGYGAGRTQKPLPNERGVMVTEWLLADRSERRANAVCLDDMDLGYTAARLRLVKPDANVGLTEADADRVIALFQGKS